MVLRRTRDFDCNSYLDVRPVQRPRYSYHEEIADLRATLHRARHTIAYLYSRVNALELFDSDSEDYEDSDTDDDDEPEPWFIEDYAEPKRNVDECVIDLTSDTE
ncbi:hypothetical protein GN958_ATG08089 [Phytophthora infestans]|uniref:Uncharacterized protein n=1 Tax=Phytophthora infestans TaxID=4787 RepID=A0A8S9USS2_PHYIN|nr:hypothetical protein GN958_ATG08089 [Phytophthora infestans]